MKAYLAQCGVRELLVAANDAPEAANAIEAAGGPPRSELLEEGGLVESADPVVLEQAARTPRSVLARPLWARRQRYEPLKAAASLGAERVTA